MSYEDKTLEDLDGEIWGEPNYNSSLVTTCYRLRRVPLRDFTVEDLRLMIGQEIGLEYLIPIALARLEKMPFAEGDFYPGDLLSNVMDVNRGFWKQHPKLRQKLKSIVERAINQLNALDDEEIRESLKEKLNAFG
jgi:hypothetical protein